MAVAVRLRSFHAKCLFIGLVRSFSLQRLGGPIKNVLSRCRLSWEMEHTAKIMELWRKCTCKLSK